MKIVWQFTKRELREYWRGPGIYFLASVFLGICGILFANYIGLYRQNYQLGFEMTVLAPFLGNVNFMFLFIAPLLSIKSIGEERSKGTLTFLLLSPVKSWQFLTAKLISMWFVCIFLIVCTLLVILPGLIYFPVSFSHLFTGYLGIILCVACYLSVGMLMSVLIETPALAALAGFGSLLGMMIFIAMAQAIDHFYLSELLKFLSVPLHYEAFLRGAIRTSDLVYLVTFCFFFVFAGKEVFFVKENW